VVIGLLIRISSFPGRPLACICNASSAVTRAVRVSVAPSAMDKPPIGLLSALNGTADLIMTLLPTQRKNRVRAMARGDASMAQSKL
jgi:hypothetical protein